MVKAVIIHQHQANVENSKRLASIGLKQRLDPQPQSSFVQRRGIPGIPPMLARGVAPQGRKTRPVLCKHDLVRSKLHRKMRHDSARWQNRTGRLSKYWKVLSNHSDGKSETFTKSKDFRKDECKEKPWCGYQMIFVHAQETWKLWHLFGYKLGEGGLVAESFAKSRSIADLVLSSGMLRCWPCLCPVWPLRLGCKRAHELDFHLFTTVACHVYQGLTNLAEECDDLPSWILYWSLDHIFLPTALHLSCE